MTGILQRLLRALRGAENGSFAAADQPATARLFVVSAPSGAGKTSLVKALLARLPNMRVSVSHTTRGQRPSEEDGSDYHFVDQQEFLRMREAGDFLESAQVFDNYYGTSRIAVSGLLDAGHDVMLEIDWQGAAQVRAAAPGAISIFILPPSREELERRLRGRSTDSDAVIRRRLADSVADMGHWQEFDYVVINDNFDHAVEALAGIVAGNGEASRADRPDLGPLLTNLLE